MGASLGTNGRAAIGLLIAALTVYQIPSHQVSLIVIILIWKSCEHCFALIN